MKNTLSDYNTKLKFQTKQQFGKNQTKPHFLFFSEKRWVHWVTISLGLLFMNLCSVIGSFENLIQFEKKNWKKNISSDSKKTCTIQHNSKKKCQRGADSNQAGTTVSTRVFILLAHCLIWHTCTGRIIKTHFLDDSFVLIRRTRPPGHHRIPAFWART